MSNYAIIVAAGKGKRFGAVKQFHVFHGRTLLLHALDPFETSNDIDKIIVVVPRIWINKTKNLIKKSGIRKVCGIVAGGKRRQDSVLNGLKAIRDKNGIVIIHDAIRPIVSVSAIKSGVKLCQKHKAVIFGTPIHDTIKHVRDNKVVKTIPRRNLYLIQTPQFFELNLIKHGFEKANLASEYTDEAAMLETLGIQVYLFPGDRFNIKITEKADLKVLEKLLP